MAHEPPEQAETETQAEGIAYEFFTAVGKAFHRLFGWADRFF